MRVRVCAYVRKRTNEVNGHLKLRASLLTHVVHKATTAVLDALTLEHVLALGGRIQNEPMA